MLEQVLSTMGTQIGCHHRSNQISLTGKFVFIKVLLNIISCFRVEVSRSVLYQLNCLFYITVNFFFWSQGIGFFYKDTHPVCHIRNGPFVRVFEEGLKIVDFRMITFNIVYQFHYTSDKIETHP